MRYLTRKLTDRFGYMRQCKNYYMSGIRDAVLLGWKQQFSAEKARNIRAF